MRSLAIVKPFVAVAALVRCSESVAGTCTIEELSYVDAGSRLIAVPIVGDWPALEENHDKRGNEM